MRKIELIVLAELMKNSRISDRELAKTIGYSQPTVTRVRRRLEQNGVIREYTLIPDFSKLGLSIMALTFSHFASALNEEEVKEVKKIYRERRKDERKRAREEAAALQIAMQETGMGLGHSGVTISFHENYESFLEFKRLAEQNSHVELKNCTKPNPILEIDEIESFVINLEDSVHYQPLTFSRLAKYLKDMNHTPT